jgi:hypothetical protein
VFLSDGSSKALQKTFYKKIVSKRIYKKIDKKSKTIFSICFDHVFGRFSVRGVQKHHKHIFAKSPCRKNSQKNRQKLRSVSVYPRFFCFIAFSGVSRRWEFKSKGTTKNVLQKNRVEKNLQKNRESGGADQGWWGGGAATCGLRLRRRATCHLRPPGQQGPGARLQENFFTPLPIAHCPPKNT